METISIREAADQLGVSHKVIRRLIAQGTLEAEKRAGPHGSEWRVKTGSLTAYHDGPSARRQPVSPSRTTVPPPSSDIHEPDHWRTDKAFLQEQVRRLTELLAAALPPGETPKVECPPPPPEPFPDVTAALKTSLRSIQGEGVCTYELCSVRVLWGKPVLWRMEVSGKDDVSALTDAILSDDAVWCPPGAEVVLILALNDQREALWGAACGPGWFGPAFEETLRKCRVERR